METEFIIDQLCFCSDFEFCNNSLIHLSRCRNLNNAIKYNPILELVISIINSNILSYEDLQKIKLPNINLNINIKAICDIEKLNDFYKIQMLFLELVSNIYNLNNNKTDYNIRIIQALCHIVIFNNNLNNFKYLIESKKYLNTMYNKVTEHINKESVYILFNDISKLFNLDQNILLIYKIY